MLEEELLPLAPANFFELGLTVPKLSPETWKEEIVMKKTRLPDTSWLLGEKKTADFHLGWSEEGLYFYAHVKGRFDQPNLASGDSLELFVDTRDRKSASYNTKFCHHFYFLPQMVEGHIKGEITRFRQQESHPLADPDEITLETPGAGKLKIFLPASILVGWHIDRLGFSYRLNRRWQPPEHFSARSDEYALEQEPSLWASCKL